MTLSDLNKMFKHIGRRISGNQTMAPVESLEGKKVIITGASPNSIGFETAFTLAQFGAEVIVSGRSNSHKTVEALKAALREKNITSKVDGHNLELSKAQSVIEFTDWYFDNHGERLDILINNAGIHLDFLSQWSEPKLIDSNEEIHWRTNYLGSSHLTHLLLPLLRQTGKQYGDARVINISSQLHDMGVNTEFFEPSLPYNSWQAYGQSKLALVHMAFEINRKFSKEYNLKGYALHPGSVYTNIAHKGLDGNGLIQNIRNLFGPIEAFFLLSPLEGAQTQILCASSPIIESGQYYERCEKGTVNKEALDTSAAERLWNETEAWVTLQNIKNSGPLSATKH